MKRSPVCPRRPRDGWASCPDCSRARTGTVRTPNWPTAEVKRLSDELDAVVVDERALRLVGRLDALTELRARHVTAELDLPSRRRELARADGEVRSILMRLEREDEPEPARLLLNAAQSAALNTLIVTRSGVEAKVMAAGDELSQSLHELTEAQRALQEAAGSASVASAGSVNLGIGGVARE